MSKTYLLCTQLVRLSVGQRNKSDGSHGLPSIQSATSHHCNEGTVLLTTITPFPSGGDATWKQDRAKLPSRCLLQSKKVNKASFESSSLHLRRNRLNFLGQRGWHGNAMLSHLSVDCRGSLDNSFISPSFFFRIWSSIAQSKWYS